MRWAWENADVLRPLIHEDDAYERALAIETCPPHYFIHEPDRMVRRGEERYRIVKGICKKCSEVKEFEVTFGTSWV